MQRHGGIFKLTADRRITRVGRFLRRYSIDELPQLINVLRGDMSLVGPRPPVPAEVDHYDVTHWMRLRVKPGMTGAWQVAGRCEPDLRGDGRASTSTTGGAGRCATSCASWPARCPAVLSGRGAA